MLKIATEPEKALGEINRVLRKDGLLIAPNFVSHKSGLMSRLWSGILKLVGIKFEHQWSGEEYLGWLEDAICEELSNEDRIDVCGMHSEV